MSDEEATRLVAEKLLGWRLSETTYSDLNPTDFHEIADSFWYVDEDSGEYSQIVFDPFTNFNDDYRVLQAMREKMPREQARKASIHIYGTWMDRMEEEADEHDMDYDEDLIELQYKIGDYTLAAARVLNGKPLHRTEVFAVAISRSRRRG